MKNWMVVPVAFCVCTCVLLAKDSKPPEALAAPAVQEEGISIYFSPKGGCTEAIVEQIKAAKKSIDVQAYSFTSTDISKALGDAQERGVKVRAVLDRKTHVTGKYSGATYLQNHGIDTFTDGEHPIAHNKVIIIDGSTVITGSFNFTKQAENSNAENLLVIERKPKLAAAYVENFEKHLAHSKPYVGVKKE